MERQDTARTAKKIHDLLAKGKYAKIISMSQSLNYVKANNSMMMLDITAAYEELNQREEARDILLNYVNSHATFSRSLLQKTITLCLETGDLQNAKVMCMKFGQMWPEDPSSLLMRCEIVAASNGSLAEQIAYLERYTEMNFEEKWGYRLAQLYKGNGQMADCAKTCHKLILYFGEGEFVENAARMKQDICGLTQEEILILSKAYPQNGTVPAAEAPEMPSDYEADRTEAPSRYAGYGEETEPEEPEYEDSEPAGDSYDYDSSYYNGQNRRADDYEQAELQARYEQSLIQAQPPIYAESDEELAEKKARYSVDSKLRQTEELARARKERNEQEIRTRQEMINRTLHNDHYQDVEKHRVPSSMDKKRDPVIFTGKDREASVNHILSLFHRRLREEGEEDDDIYINVGVNSERYAEEIENNLRDELTMLSEEQVRELTGAQVKEIHELLVLKDVRSMISALIKASVKDLPETDTAQFIANLSTFEEMDPYRNLADELNEQEIAKKEAEARAEARARAEALERARKESRRIAEERAKAEEARRQEEARLAEEEALRKAEEEKAKQLEAEKAAAAATAQNLAAEEAVPEMTADAADAAPEMAAEAADAAPEMAAEAADAAPEMAAEAADAAPEMAAKAAENAVPELTAENAAEPENTEAEADNAPEEQDAKTAADFENAGKLQNQQEAAKPDAMQITGDMTAEASVKATDNVTIDIAEVVKQRTILDEISDPEADLSSETFMDVVAALAEEQGYTIAEDAFMTVAVLSDQMQEKQIPLSLNNARAMVEQAVAKAKKRSLADKLLDRANKKNITTMRDKHFDFPKQA